MLWELLVLGVLVEKMRVHWKFKRLDEIGVPSQRLIGVVHSTHITVFSNNIIIIIICEL